jgi:hypothetical protein
MSGVSSVSLVPTPPFIHEIRGLTAAQSIVLSEVWSWFFPVSPFDQAPLCRFVFVQLCWTRSVLSAATSLLKLVPGHKVSPTSGSCLTTLHENHEVIMNHVKILQEFGNKFAVKCFELTQIMFREMIYSTATSVGWTTSTDMRKEF